MIRQLLEQFGDDGRTFAHVKLRFFVSLQPHGLAYLFRFRRKKKMFFFSSCSRIQPDKSILNLHERFMYHHHVGVCRLQAFGNKSSCMQVHA